MLCVSARLHWTDDLDPAGSAYYRTLVLSSEGEELLAAALAEERAAGRVPGLALRPRDPGMARRWVQGRKFGRSQGGARRACTLCWSSSAWLSSDGPFSNTTALPTRSRATTRSLGIAATSRGACHQMTWSFSRRRARNVPAPVRRAGRLNRCGASSWWATSRRAGYHYRMSSSTARSASTRPVRCSPTSRRSSRIPVPAGPTWRR